MQSKNLTSAVTIIVVTIFIAIFQIFYRDISCACGTIYLRGSCAMQARSNSPPVYSNFSTLQSRAAKDVTRVIAARRPWLSSVSVRERRRNCL